MSEQYGGNMFFPIHNTGHGQPFDEGISLRDYIAVQAMQGLVANNGTNPYEIARAAYVVADAMMQHRDSGE